MRSAKTGATTSSRSDQRLRIYTASSWRNEKYPAIVEAIKRAGHEVYDFRNPWDAAAAFNWEQVDPTWSQEHPNVDARRFRAMLNHPLSKRGFASDKAGMDWAQTCVLVLPCGASAHMEAGYFVGQGKPVVVFLDGGRPELTYSLATNMTDDVHELVALLHGVEEQLAILEASKR